MRILVQPIISEKTMIDTEHGKFTFKVDQNANKHQIAEEIKNIYKVDPVKVNIIKVKPEEKTVRGRYQAKIKGFKKAIVTLKKGQKIEGYEIKE